MKLFITISLLILLTSASLLQADELTIEPGLWEITTEVSGAMMQPQTKTVKECITEDKLDPQEMMKDMPKDDCAVETEVSGNTMTYTLNCNMHGMVMQGTGEMKSTGDTMSGTVSFSGGMNGMMMEMTSTSNGKRIGDCQS